jgi:cyclopropane fatty-acyl-phospholipid synthase-like methyltransferase
MALMSIGYVRALRILHRAFAHYPAHHRLHILIRFLTCPFPRTVEDVPAGARVLEIGSGHGLYSVLIAEERAREVVAVDPDLKKSLLPTPSPKIRKIGGYDDCVTGTFDAIVIYDATYRMSLEVRRALFERVFQRLRPGGVFLWKDMDPAHPFKMKWARFQEWLSDTVLHISLGEGFLHQTREEVAAMLGEIGFTGLEARAIDRGYVHPHLLYTARRPIT